ncbi:MAG: hypothetical protein IKH26_08110 [Bacteroidaceae bacterium]|nr:hypothetical protein [Bacteroidaceae bacterium]
MKHGSPVLRIIYTGDGGYSDRFERYGKMYPERKRCASGLWLKTEKSSI